MPLRSRPWMPDAADLYRWFLQIAIYPSLWVAVAIATLSVFVQTTLQLEFDWRPPALIVCAALVPYNLDRIADTFVQTIPDRQAQAFFRSPGVGLLVLAAAVGTGVLIYQAPAAVRWVSLGGLVPLLYGLPLFPWPASPRWRWYRIKDIPGAKAWLVCGSITYAVVALPLAYAAQPLTPSALITALWLLVFIGSNSHMFDVRDVDSDRQKGVSTLPILAGVRGARWILTGLNGLGWLLLGWGWSHGLQVPSGAVAVPATLLTLTYVWTLTPQTPRQIYNIWIDGVLFVPALVLGLMGRADLL